MESKRTEKLTRDLAELEAKRAELTQRAGELQAQIGDLKATLPALSLDDAEKAERAEEEIGERSSHLARLEAALGELAKRIDTAKAELYEARAADALVEVQVIYSRNIVDLLQFRLGLERVRTELAAASERQARVRALHQEFPRRLPGMSLAAQFDFTAGLAAVDRLQLGLLEWITQIPQGDRPPDLEQIYQQLWQRFYGEQSRSNRLEAEAVERESQRSAGRATVQALTGVTLAR